MPLRWLACKVRRVWKSPVILSKLEIIRFAACESVAGMAVHYHVFKINSDKCADIPMISVHVNMVGKLFDYPPP